MKKPALIVIIAVLLVFNVIPSAFPQDSNPKARLSRITSDIPENWWEGGWDKLTELKDFILDNPGEPDLCANAQYYIGCYYHSEQKYREAIEQYRKVLTLYPCATSQCLNSQYEIGQATLHGLNSPREAIAEYSKIISDYPNENPNKWGAPVAQLLIGRAYVKLGNADQAKIEFQKVIDNYADFAAEACMDLGDIYTSEGLYKEALSCYKKAYLVCPVEDLDTMVHIMDGIYGNLRGLDNSMARANLFIRYQRYGPFGEDSISGTSDDLTDPLAEF